MDISTKSDTNPSTTRYIIRGGYSRVSIQTYNNVVTKKMPLYYCPGCLSFNAIVDALFSKAVAQFEGTPVIHSIRTDSKSLYIKMPYLGTSLYAVPVEQRRKYAYQILGDIAKTCLDLEAIGIQHTDIKHSNIILSKTGEVYLIDFNICSIKHVNAGSLWTENLGTWEYASPEICLLNHPTNTSTVWSLGILMCYLFCEHPLQDYMDDHEIDSSDQKKWGRYLDQVSTAHPIGLPLSETLLRVLPYEMRKLFHKCTYWDPLRRISLADFYRRIRGFKEYKVVPRVQFPLQYFVMTPKSSVERDEDLEKMYKWCEDTKQLFLLCRSIAIYDRITYSENPTMDAPACLAIAYMLIGNYVHLDDSNMSLMATLFEIKDWDLFLKHIIDVCEELHWDAYELSADVMLLSHIEKVDDLPAMMNTVFSIQKSTEKSYTMRSLAKSFQNMVLRGAYLKE